ncbi:uncharacterized protein NPIL_581591 [Nephila pilipes]|uniref:Uncharacterized protein n=1 Tax=Nephila pilipes TaxID=299642 RepID=A0A8X6TCP2_NEPPI|nr:uncharacterized protein NPIL_581591 [Nephila pilipes]
MEDHNLGPFSRELFTYVYRNHIHSNGAISVISEESAGAASTHIPPNYLPVQMEFYKTFRESFRCMLLKTSPLIFAAEYVFVTYALSICNKLCKSDMFSSFLIMCAFLIELANFTLDSKCYRFVFVIPDILIDAIRNNFGTDAFSVGGTFSNFQANLNHLHRNRTLKHISTSAIRKYITDGLGNEYFGRGPCGSKLEVGMNLTLRDLMKSSRNAAAAGSIITECYLCKINCSQYLSFYLTSLREAS